MKTRGLMVRDDATAIHYLKHIGYYRLSGYALPFQVDGSGPDRHNYMPGTSFDDILNRYVFDRKLRLLAMDAIERIEISIRSALSNELAAKHGTHWHEKTVLFIQTFNHPGFIDQIKKQIGHDPADKARRDVYIAH